MGKKIDNIRQSWQRIRKSTRFHNVLMFLIFVFIAIIFWFILALNDNVTETFRVKINIINKPDSVTFITDPPTEIHVTLRDKGTQILRSGFVKNRRLNIDFAEYASDGVLRMTYSDLLSQLKTDLGGVAQITSASIDSLRCYYTTSPGRRVPIIIRSDVTAASGYVINGQLTPDPKSVLVYSYGEEADTVKAVYTQKLVKKGLSQSAAYTVKLLPIPGVKIVPSSIKVNVNVDALVHKETFVTIDPLNVPEGENIVLFPAKVPVSFFVPMSSFNEDNISIHVVVDYNDIKNQSGSMLPVHITASSSHYVNVKLMTDSVEYSLVRQ